MHLAYVAVFLCQVRCLILFHLVSFLLKSGNYVVDRAQLSFRQVKLTSSEIPKL